MEPANQLIITSLSDGWRDKDNVLLHACFQLLKDCVEQEHLLDGNTDWQANPEHSKAYDELTFLYQWWIQRDKGADDCGVAEPQYQLENEMLHRLINVRWAMWT